MSEDKKDVTEEENEETSTPEEEAEESQAETSEGSDESSEPSDADESSEASDEEEASDEDDPEEEEASDEDDADDEEETSDEDDSDEEETSEEDDSDDDADASDEDDPDDEDEASEEDDSDDEDASDEDDSDDEEDASEEDDEHDDADASDEHGHGHGDDDVVGIAAFFDHPDHLMYAAEQTRDSDYSDFDAYSPFPIHGMDDAMGLERSWLPWVTFFAGLTGLLTAATIQFGIMGFDWPMVYGGKPFIAWPSFVPVMFELTVLFAGHTTAIVMMVAAGLFRKPLIIDPDITNDRFALWISANDDHFDRDGVIEFMKELNPMEIRTIRKDAEA